MTPTTDNATLVITRVVNAPKTVVFQAFSEVERLAQWWGPAGFSIQIKKLEFKKGGIFHYCLENEGQTMWGRFIYGNIDAPNSIEFTNSFSDENGGITRAPFAPNWALEVFNTITFTEQDGKTLVTLQGHPINATEDEINMFATNHRSMQQGFAGTFNQLDAYLARG